MTNFKVLAIEMSKELTANYSPIEENLINLSNKNIAELNIYNLLYGWFFLQENKPTELNEKSAEFYFGVVLLKVTELVPDIDAEKLYPIYIERFQTFREELGKVRKTIATINPYFPINFYHRILNHPLSNNVMDTSKMVKNGNLSEFDFQKLFIDQINFLNRQIRKAV
jgi:hypothetical protein